MECLLRLSVLHLLDTRFILKNNGMEEWNIHTAPALSEESTSVKGMTSTKHSKVVREGFSSSLGL